MSSQQVGSQSAQDVSRNVGRWWWVVVLITVLGVGAGVGSAVLAPTRYAATVTFVVELSSADSDTEALVRTAEALTTSSVVLDDVARASGTGLSAAEIEKRLKVERSVGSSVIEVTAEDTSQDRARVLAEQIVPSLTARIDETRDGTGTAAAPLRVQTFSGGPQLNRIDPPLVRNSAFGGAAGAAIGLVLANALGSYSDRPRPRRDRRAVRRRAERWRRRQTPGRSAKSSGPAA